MIINRFISDYIVFAEDAVLVALGKISANKHGIVFCVDEHAVLVGALSDGDFRRWIVSTPTPDLNQACAAIANKNPLTAPANAKPSELSLAFGPGKTVIPLVDERGHIKAVATREAQEFRIGRHLVGKDHPSVLIAEIGNNHNGSVDLAKQLVNLAADAGADIVKFQLRDMAALYRNDSADISKGEDLGAQYTLNLLAKFSLDAERMIEVFDHCKDRDIDVICTPWDLPSIDVLANYPIPTLKIASADLTNHELLTHAANYRLPLVISTGMSTEDEIAASTNLVRSTGTPFALLHCQSTYPAPFKDVNLAYLDRLAEIGQCPVGYSGHERGYHVPIAAVARGAKIIEKHFTIDRAMEGNDHKVSLLPDEFKAMVDRIREVEEAIGSAEPRVVSTGEMMNRVNLAKSLVAARPIAKGHIVTSEDVSIKSPGRGLQPNKLNDLIGKTIGRDVAEGDFFYPGDLTSKTSRGRAYSFNRPWGLPVRYHDWRPLVEEQQPDFLEFHMSYKDVEMNIHEVFDEKLPMFFTVHLPDLYAGDFIVDLASQDEAIWERSIIETQKVINITRELTQYFTCDEPPIVIATMGGFTADAFVPEYKRPAMYARIAQALERIDESDVRLTSQTLPPYPWLMGGQQYHNLFMGLEDTIDFCTNYGRYLTLDTSHTKLAANYYQRPFSEFVNGLAPFTQHLHIVDAEGVDGEGPQIGEGEIDWPVLASQLDSLTPGVAFIPEIWMGHVNNGEGFWTALDRLETWL